MFRYYFVYPPAYKILSANRFTIQFYRTLGNKLGDRLKSQRGLSQNSVNQGRRLVRLLGEYADVRDGAHFLELGTGWVHWYSTFVRLFYNANITLFDVWDNRQIQAFRQFVSQLPDHLTEEEMAALGPSIELLHGMQRVNSFEELYDLANYRYVIDEHGSLSAFPDNAFDVLFSCAVFEHIDRSILPEYVADMHRILKPGGVSIQIIDMGDHYHYLDPKDTHMKEYLRFSDRLWRLYFENRIHYINRVQASEWLALFQDAGFELLHKEQFYTDIGPLKVHRDYQHFSEDDLRCHQLVVVHQKPHSEARE